MKFWREEIIMGGIFGLGTVLCLLGITITLASMSIDNLLDFIGRVVLVIIIGFALFIVGTLWGSDSEFIAGYTLFIRSWVVVAICIGLVVTINDGSVPGTYYGRLNFNRGCSYNMVRVFIKKE